MEILFLLIPISTVLVLVAAIAFIWAVRSGQFDDMDSPAWRILLDDESERSVKPGQIQTDNERKETDS